jgi:hypothetical protein
MIVHKLRTCASFGMGRARSLWLLRRRFWPLLIIGSVQHSSNSQRLGAFASNVTASPQ